MKRSLIEQRFSKALSSYDDHAVVQQQIHRQLIQVLQQKGRTHFDRILEIGCGTGGLTQLLTSACSANEWIINDLCEDYLPKLAECFIDKNWHYLPGDAEILTFPGVFDLVASASAIQWFHAPSYFIQRMIGQLSNNAILLLSTFGKNNLCEIKKLTGKGLLYHTVDQVRGWVNPFFEIQYLEEEEVQLPFDNPIQVLQHLKYTGVTGTNATVWTRSILQQFCNEYIDRYSINGKVTLTYHPIYLLAAKR